MISSSWSQGSPTTLEAAPRAASLSIRLWTSAHVAEPAAAPWEGEGPAVCLILDLISASGGAPSASQGEVLVAEFLSFEAAILCARRLQWAVQGFSETEGLQTTSLAVLVHAPEEKPGQISGGELAHLLDQATPGQILLTEKARQPFENLPGFPLLTASGDGLRELLWRGPENQSTRSSDEEVLARLVAEQGGQSRPQEEPAQQEAAGDAAGGRFQEQLRSQPQSQSQSGRPLWQMGAAVAALVLVAVAIVYFSHGKPNPAPDQSPAQTETAAAANAPVTQAGQPSPGPAAPGAKLSRAEMLAAAKAAKNGQKIAAQTPNPPAAGPQVAEKPPAPRVVEPPPTQRERGRCDLEPSQYAGQIAQAEKNLARGKYADAQREFGAVLACEPGNGRAREGLERARMAAQTEN
jgi:hypothetical protein